MVERRNLGNFPWEEAEKNQRVTNEEIIDIFSTLPLQQAIISCKSKVTAQGLWRQGIGNVESERVNQKI